MLIMELLQSKANTLINTLSLIPTVAKKHHFFDSGLLYQFCINFRCRRRLSELLNETRQDNDEEATVPTQEENNPGSLFGPSESQTAEDGNNAFQSGKKNGAL